VLQKSTIQLLRFKFSYLLLPVYLFAIAMADQINVQHAVIIFLLLHLLLYPASNGYNSYMDRDEGSIGGIEHPMKPTKQLYTVSVIMDITGLLLSLSVGLIFSALYFVYIVCSRLYSYRGVRLKQYAVTGYLTVIINQGALTFYMIYYGSNAKQSYDVPIACLIISALLIGAFYPITQVYQHEQDAADGIYTISYKLGVRGTFIYCGLLYFTAFAILAWYLKSLGRLNYFFILQLWFIPVIIYFLWWAWQCWKNAANANYKNTMRMNWLAASCTNMAFLTIIFLKHFG